MVLHKTYTAANRSLCRLANVPSAKCPVALCGYAVSPRHESFSLVKALNTRLKTKPQTQTLFVDLTDSATLCASTGTDTTRGFSRLFIVIAITAVARNPRLTLGGINTVGDLANAVGDPASWPLLGHCPPRGAEGISSLKRFIITKNTKIQIP